MRPPAAMPPLAIVGMRSRSTGIARPRSSMSMNGSNANRANCCSTLLASGCAKSGSRLCGSAAIAKRTLAVAGARSAAVQPPAHKTGSSAAAPSRTAIRIGGHVHGQAEAAPPPGTIRR